MPTLFLMIALALSGFIAFANSIPHPFVHDEIVFIVQNPQINRLDNLSDIFFPLAKPLTAGLNTYYRPVLEIVYRLEYKVFGFNAHGFHLVNVLLHITNGLLLFGLLQRLGLARLTAWLVSLFFLIHPLQGEAVACVAGISNLLMAFFVLLSLHAYLRGWWVATALLLGVALLTKEQAVMVPLLIIFLDIYRRQKENRGQRSIFSIFWLRWGILIALTVASLLWRGAVTGSSLIGDIMQSPGELVLRLKAIAPVLLTDLRLIILPYDLHYYRSYDILQPYLSAWLILLALLLAGVLMYRRMEALRGAMILGVGWFFITLLPLLNVVPLINEYSFILTAEHFLYLPIIGVLIIIGSLLSFPNVLIGNLFLRILIVVLVLISTILTIRQNTQWRSEIALFENTMQFEPNFARGHLLLAKAYYFNNRMDDASPHFAKAYAIMESYANKTRDLQAKRFYLGFMKGILFDWAHTFEAKGQWSEALAKYEQALKIDPNDLAIRNNAIICTLKLEQLR